MLSAIWNWFCTLDWLALLSGCALTTIGFGIRALMREPLRAVTRDARFIRLFWWLTPQRPFKGSWTVRWNVSSSRFPLQNVDTVSVRHFFNYVAFKTQTTLNDGETEECVFIGKLHNQKLTGRWHNAADEANGYYGVFQMHIHAGRKEANGAWAGFTNDGNIQANNMTMTYNP